MTKIAIASDHAGFEYKSAITDYLKKRGYEVIDFGTDSDKSVDYPVYAKKLCSAILSGQCEKGVLLCGTGIGMSMAANRFNGIRAALCPIPEYAKLAREHNNANVLCLGSRFIDINTTLRILDVFLDSEFQGGRHENRVNQIDIQ
ncbi:MAG: ribose 5-phosphate isomerase B [Clostridiales bacterium]|nr:ribose 5-phosphate isomerase B [Clostridiales bacterium]